MEDFISKYQYHLPDNLIASVPIEPRDHARVLIYDTKADSIVIDHFYNLHNYVPTQSLLVMNTTKVVPARVILYKPTGGKIECLFLVNETTNDGTIKIIVDRKLEPGVRLTREDFAFDVVSQDEQFFFLKPLFSIERLEEFLAVYGTTPTPKYLGEQKLSEDELRIRYQSLMADAAKPKSVAAPTASLHFTDAVFQNLAQQGTRVAPVTLHVGMGTFAPLNASMIKDKKLHTEWYEIDARTVHDIQNTKKSSNSVIAVGTTVVRTLESAGSELLNQTPRDYSGDTNIFIYPPHNFIIPDQLITNFHVPRSSLMCLVDAFLQHKGAGKSILDLYQIAIENQMRFFSFGDALYIK